MEEARRAWKGKTIWANFPATVYLETGLKGVEKQTINMLENAPPGDSFLLGITEDIEDILSLEYMQILKTITTTVMKHGIYPIAGSRTTTNRHGIVRAHGQIWRSTMTLQAVR